MLSIGRTSSYAISALSLLAQRGERWVLLSELAAAAGAPAPYLSKLLHRLARSGLVRTKRGYKGGYSLARPAKALSALEVIEAVEGPDPLCECLLGREFCTDERACPTHRFWKVERGRIRALLADLSLDAIAEFERNHDRPGRKRTNRTASTGGPRARRKSKLKSTNEHE